MIEDDMLDLTTKLFDTRLFFRIELQFLWNVVLTVIVVECHLIEIKAFARCKEHPHFFHREGTLKHIIWEILHFHLYQQPNHLSDLVVHEGLA